MTAIWELADGTKVTLDGEVEGDTALAKRLRRDVALARAGGRVSVRVAAPPGGLENLVIGDLELMDHWVHNEGVRMDVKVVSGPEFEHEPVEPSNAPPGTIF